MKIKSRENRARATTVGGAVPKNAGARWPYLLAAAAAVLAVSWAYAPALHGSFLFDDTALPFSFPDFSASLRVWLRNVRPALYFTYWANARMSGDDPFSYHATNVVFHCITGGLVFLAIRRLLEWSRSNGAVRNLLAGFGAAVFLLHPAQSEAVAYLAGRSEALSVMFFLGAFAVFLYRPRPAVSWPVAAAVLALFGLALLSKEHTIVLPALLLLTDYWWNPGSSLAGIRSNWRLYIPTAIGALAGVAMFWQLITTAPTAGFALKDFTWYQYFFTQCRALFVYIGTFLLPVRLNADWDFPISKTILDRGAIAGLAALLALAAVAWRYRRRFPLATYGFFVYLVLMAPTSSILPIRDTIADRRLYISMLGLLLVVVDLLGRLQIDRRALAAACLAVALVLAAATHARAAVWADPVALWQDAAGKSPGKTRVHFQLGYAYLDSGRPALAIPEFQKTADLNPPAWMTYNLLVDWALAYDAEGKADEALAKLHQAAALEPTAHVYTQICVVYAKRAQWNEALDALATAQKLDAGFAMIYVYRGNIRLKQNDPAAAVPEYQRALAIQPTLEEARRNLALAQQELLRKGR